MLMSGYSTRPFLCAFAIIYGMFLCVSERMYVLWLKAIQLVFGYGDSLEGQLHGELSST